MDSGGFGAAEMAERIAQNPINPTIERTTILIGSPTVPVSFSFKFPGIICVSSQLYFCYHIFSES
jgi:hypothetical protein